MASRAERAAFWRDQVEGWRRSGQTQAAYCAEQGLSVNSLAYWLRRLRREALEPPEPLTLVAVRAEPDCRSAGASAPALSLHNSAGWRLEFGALPPAAWLAELLAWLACSKFLDHLPLYRLEQIGARSNVALPRSTLASWVGAIGVALQPLADRLAERLRCGQVIHADETPVAQLDPGRGKPCAPICGPIAATILKGGRRLSFSTINAVGPARMRAPFSPDGAGI